MKETPLNQAYFAVSTFKEGQSIAEKGASLALTFLFLQYYCFLQAYLREAVSMGQICLGLVHAIQNEREIMPWLLLCFQAVGVICPSFDPLKG